MKLFGKMNLNILCVFIVITTAGCVPLLVGAAAGVGGVTYVKGAVVQNVTHTVDKVNKASVKALKDLKLFIISDELNKHSSVVKAEDEKGKKISVFIDALTEYSSKITIRVGTFGDQVKSQEILNAILKKL